MARVISTLPNQAAVTNGVKFEEDKGQFLSEDVSDEVAANFASIPGYRIAGKRAPAAAAAPDVKGDK